jgi:hypothetical protein
VWDEFGFLPSFFSPEGREGFCHYFYSSSLNGAVHFTVQQCAIIQLDDFDTVQYLQQEKLIVTFTLLQ